MRDTPNPFEPNKTQPTIPAGSDRQLRRLEIAFWLIAAGLGFSHVWADHHYLINADAMSYLDVAEAYLRRDWHTAVNSYWSPLYSWLIALGLLVVRPSPYWKFAVVHLVNFAIYLFALACFCFLMREMIRRHRSLRDEGVATTPVTLPDWALLALGYSLFIWSTLFLIVVQEESPDMLVAAFVYLACGILLRIRQHPFSWVSFVLLGIGLGFGYLSKSVMLPMSLIFLVASIFATGNLRRALPRVSLAVILFLLIAGLYIFAISRAKGRLTFGDSGKLNYLWSINDVTSRHWQGDEPGSGVPKHPTRKIFDTPPTYEFGNPVGGTYPVWYDPTYWYEGSVSHFDFRQQLVVLLEGVKAYYELFHKWGLQYGLLIGLLTLYLMGRRRWLLLHDLILQWYLLVPALAGIGLYSLVHVQGRYVASFVVLLWLSLFSAVRLKSTLDSPRLIKSLTVILVVIMLFTTVASSSREIFLTARQLVAGEDPSVHEQFQVAEGLREMGLVPGENVAFIGDSYRAFWAHLLGLRIAAEIRRDKLNSFWEADSNLKDQVINAFARTSAKAIVAEKPPPGSDLHGWQKIRQTDYYIYSLKK